MKIKSNWVGLCAVVISSLTLVLVSCSPPGGGGTSKKSSNGSNSQIGSAQSNENADTAPTNNNNNTSEYNQFITSMGDPVTENGEAPPADDTPPSNGGDQQSNNSGSGDASDIPGVPASQIDCYRDQQGVTNYEQVSVPVCGRAGRPNQSFSVDAVKLVDCSVNGGGHIRIYAKVFAPTSGGPSNMSAPRQVSSSSIFAFYDGVMGSGNRFSSGGAQEYFPKASPELKASLIRVFGLKDVSSLDNYCSPASNSDFYISKVGKVLSDGRTGLIYRRPYGYAGTQGQANAYGANWGNTVERQRPTIIPISCSVYKPICPTSKQTSPAPSRGAPTAPGSTQTK